MSVVPPLGGRVLRRRITNSVETSFIESRDSVGSKLEGFCEKRSFQISNLPTKGGTTNFSFVAMADPIYRRDRSAPLPRPLSPGVGSRAGIPRRDAGPVGQARLAKQTRIAVAQSGRFLGRALATAPKMGG